MKTVAGRSIWVIVAAAVGASLLLVVALARWGAPSDEYAYWLAARRLIEGQPLYDPTVSIVTPFASSPSVSTLVAPDPVVPSPADSKPFSSPAISSA